MTKHVCNICGKDLDIYDEQEGFGFHYPYVGYGSKFDECVIDLDLCCSCFDTPMDKYIIPKCKLSPVISQDDFRYRIRRKERV